MNRLKEENSNRISIKSNILEVNFKKITFTYPQGFTCLYISKNIQRDDIGKIEIAFIKFIELNVVLSNSIYIFKLIENEPFELVENEQIAIQKITI